MSKKIDYKVFYKLEPSILYEVLELEKAIFPEPLGMDKLKRELSTKHSITFFMAYVDRKPIAYKVGFERSARIYYSWIGGVTPDYRNSGVAKKLMEQQHAYAKNEGYSVVCTQTDNSFKPMLILNLKSGFEVKGTIQSCGDDHLTIILEKEI